MRHPRTSRPPALKGADRITYKTDPDGALHVRRSYGAGVVVLRFERPPAELLRRVVFPVEDLEL